MSSSWATYYKVVQLNNITGIVNPGGDYTNPTTTPIMVLSDSQGSGYTPMTTQFIDVYSGGSPFTLTQELVQRGAEVQEEEIQLAVCGNTIEEVTELVEIIRRALSYQEYTNTQILSIRRNGQTKYTEWLVQSAIIQETPTFLGRDVQRNIPVAYLNIKITRSPYGADSSRTELATVGWPVANTGNSFYGDGLFDIIDLSDKPYLIGSMVNADISFNYDDIFSDPNVRFGPTVLSIVADDTVTQQALSVSGSLSAGASATVSLSLSYTMLDMYSNAPLVIAITGNVESNEIEMQATIKGYSTPYVRSIGTNINTSNNVNRLFIMPPIDIGSIFSGFPNYNTAYTVPIQINIRNINRGAARTYAFSRVWLYRAHSTIQLFPTSVWTARTERYIQYRVASFYDQTEMPAQPLPAQKAMITTSQSSSNNWFSYSEACEIRGPSIRVQQMTGMMRGLIFNLNGVCTYLIPIPEEGQVYAPALYMQFRFGALYQTIQE
jgi:hypothetical protein